MTDEDRKLWGKGEEPVELRLAGLKTPLFLAPKVFSTGSVGWYLSQKVVFNDSPCQLNLCLTVVGTKREATVDTKPVDELVSPIFPEEPSANGKAPAGPAEPPATEKASKSVRKRQTKP